MDDLKSEELASASKTVPASAAAAKPTQTNLPVVVASSDALTEFDVASSTPDSSSPMEKGGGSSAATTLIALAKQQVELFRQEDKVYATVALATHHETWETRGRHFKLHLQRMYYEATNRAIPDKALGEALAVLDAEGRFGATPGKPVSLRVGQGQNGAVYIDLCNDDWQTIKIDRDGYKVVEAAESEVKFTRTNGMQALPAPTPGGDLQRLREILNVPEDRWPLVIGWLLAALKPSGPYPILVLFGEQGSAKSTTARMLRALIDPHKVPVRSLPGSVRDLMVAASRTRILAFDNLSFISQEMSDAFCCLSTGGGYGGRELFTSDEETLFDVQRPLIINGIEEVTTRGDLIERSLIIELPTITAEKRRTERSVWSDFQGILPGILGILCAAVSKALADQDKVKLDSLPRLADAAMWVTAAEPAVGLNAGSFVQALADGRRGASAIALESSPVAEALRSYLVINKGFDGEPNQLLHELTPYAPRNCRRWPTNPKGLSDELRRLKPNLLDSGIRVDFGKHPGSNSRRRVIVEAQPGCVASVAPSIQAPFPVSKVSSPLAPATQIAVAREMGVKPEPQPAPRGDAGDARQPASSYLDDLGDDIA